MFYFSLVVLLALGTINSVPVYRQKREVFVDGNGFFLGGGANNNLREASQLFDLGGPIVNPWLNPWTQPLPRGGFISAPSAVPAVGPLPEPSPAPAPPAPQQQQSYGQQQIVVPQQQQQSYGQQTQVVVPQQQQQQQSYSQQTQAVVPQQQQQQSYGQQTQVVVPQQQQQQSYSQQQVVVPQQQQQQSYGQQQQPQQLMPVQSTGFLSTASIAPQQSFIPAQQYNSPIMQTYNAPQPVPQQTFVVQQQQPQQTYGGQQQQQLGGFLGPSPVQSQIVSAPASVSVTTVGQGSPDTNQKPFTAVFIPGEQTKFKLGTPQDFHTGAYTSI